MMRLLVLIPPSKDAKRHIITNRCGEGPDFSVSIIQDRGRQQTTQLERKCFACL